MSVLKGGMGVSFILPYAGPVKPGVASQPSTPPRSMAAGPKIFRRLVSPVSLPQVMTALLPPVDLRDIPMHASAAEVTMPLQYSVLLPPSISGALRKLARRHAMMSGSRSVAGRVSVIRGTPCPRWHVDKVALRGILTLHGPGTELLAGTRVERVQTGDAVLIPGAGTKETETDNAVWHRSPQCESGCRIIVQTDCVD